MRLCAVCKNRMEIKYNDKLNLTVASRFLTQGITGVQRYGIEMSRALKKINKDINMQFISPKKVLHEQIAEDLNVVKYGLFKGHLWDQVGLLFYLKKAGNPLVMNFANTLPILYKNKISAIHDITHVKFPQSRSLFYNLYYKYLFPLMIKTSKHIITVSEFSKKELIEFYKINEEDISVVYDCVGSQFRPERCYRRDKYSDNYILAVSSIAYHKNFHGIIEAFSKLRNKKIKLYIVGGLNQKIFGKKSYEILRKIKTNSNIRFLGAVSDKELIILYSNAQCFIYPSFYEGFGLPPLEAQACGCPAVVSDIPVFREVYKGSAVFCDPYDTFDVASKIDTVLQSKYLRLELIDKGFINAENYDCNKSAAKLLNIIKKFI